MTLNITDLKECTGCKRLLSLDSYSRRKNKNGNMRLVARCRECMTAYNRKWKQDNPEKVKLSRERERAKRMSNRRPYIEERAREQEAARQIKRLSSVKKCSSCREIKDKSFFSKHKLAVDGLQYSCKQCMRELTSDWTEQNIERQHELQRNWYEKNREQHLERSRQWSADNLDKKAQYRRNRRAAEINAPGTATLDQVEARMAYHGYRCVYCGGNYEAVEHVFPLSKGGSNWPANLVPSCTSCNTKKLARNVWEFLASIERRA